MVFAYEAITLSGRPFQATYANRRFCNFRFDRQIEGNAPPTLPQLTLA